MKTAFLLVSVCFMQYAGTEGTPVELGNARRVDRTSERTMKVFQHTPKDWSRFYHWSLPFPSLPSVSSLFTDSDEIDVKKRIEALEDFQKQILELLKKITEAPKSPCNAHEKEVPSSDNEKPAESQNVPQRVTPMAENENNATTPVIATTDEAQTVFPDEERKPKSEKKDEKDAPAKENEKQVKETNKDEPLAPAKESESTEAPEIDASNGEDNKNGTLASTKKDGMFDEVSTSQKAESEMVKKMDKSEEVDEPVTETTVDSQTRFPQVEQNEKVESKEKKDDDAEVEDSGNEETEEKLEMISSKDIPLDATEMTAAIVAFAEK